MDTLYDCLAKLHDEFIVITFPDKETGDIVCCFCHCSKCRYLDKCDHSDPDHY